MITAQDLKTALINASVNISAHKKDVDNLNVFPVPDGDTGTNLSLTLEACIKEIKEISGVGAGALADKAACSLLKGARGNSGVILALIFKGFAQSVDGLDYIDGKALAKGLEAGCDEAYAAVEKPAEGTMLTVIRIAASKAAEAADKGKGCKDVFKAALGGARNALKSTPSLLPILKKHSVVDAGGQGLVYIMEGMLSLKETAASTNSSSAKYENNEIRFTYCTEFLIDKNEKCDVSKLRRFLADIGDCTVAVESKGIVKVHVHTNSPDLAIGKGLEYGELSSIKIDNMRLQAKNKNALNACSLIEICNGRGIKKYLEGFGGVYALECKEAFNASTGEIIDAVNSLESEDIFILTNNKNNLMASNQAAEMSGKNVTVIPTRNIAEGISAAKAFNPDLSAEQNKAAVEAAVKSCISGAVTYTAKQCSYGNRELSPGQIIGICGDEIICINEDIVTSAVNVISHLTNKHGKRNVTVFYGKDTNLFTAKKLINNADKNIEINITEGGQPVYYFLILVE